MHPAQNVEVTCHAVGTCEVCVPQTCDEQFPVQVNFYFWLDKFLSLVAEDRFPEANDHLNSWRENPRRACRPCLDGTEADIDEQGNDNENIADADRYRRCLAAYAAAAQMHMQQTTNNAACIIEEDVAVWASHELQGRGRCILATQAILAGEEIEVQCPLALLQNDASKLLCPTCLRCIGTPLAQWSQLPIEGRAPFPRGVEDLFLYNPSEGPKVDRVPCRYHAEGCTVVFCSKACEEKAHGSHHGLICISLLTSVQADAYTEILALSRRPGNNLLLLAIHILADVLAEIQSAGMNIETNDLRGIVEDHVGQFRSELWESLTDVEEDAATRVRDMRDFAALADQLLGPFCDALRDAALLRDLLLSPKSLSRCVGMLQLVCHEACLFSPLALSLRMARETDTNSSTNVSLEPQQLLAAFAGSPTGRQLQRPSVAYAMVPFIALCNHSCSPNIEVDFRHEVDRPGLFCIVTATRSIAPGEELCLQYIQVVATSFANRQAELLRTWAFNCSCTRCAAEAMFSESDAAWFCEGIDSFRADDEKSSFGSD